jgi:signal transduction histidine kinase
MGIIATLLGIYSTFPYVTAVLKHKTKPHQFSWLLFTIMNAIVFLSQFFSGGRQSILISLVFLIGSLIIFLLSLKYGTHETSRLDKLLLMFALFTIVVWIFTRNNELAIWLTVVIDLVATTMIVLKVRNTIDSEALTPWMFGTAAFVFTCLSLIGSPFGVLYIRPIYGFISDLVIVLSIYYFSSKRRNK